MLEHLKNLQLLGLNKNQAKIYLALISEYSLTTEEIINKTMIPRTKIYSNLKILEEKNWIVRLDSRPYKYIANPPDNIYQKKTEELLHNLQETENLLKNQWEEREKFQTETISVISGAHFLTNETLIGISGANKAIVLALRFVFPGEIEKIIKSLEIQKSNGISIKLVIFPEVYQNFNEDTKMRLKNLNIFKLGPVPLRALLVDNEYTILSFFSSVVGIEKTETIKITNSSFVEMLRNSFNITFEKFDLP